MDNNKWFKVAWIIMVNLLALFIVAVMIDAQAKLVPVLIAIGCSIVNIILTIAVGHEHRYKGVEYEK